jgi:hypothetical protein
MERADRNRIGIIGCRDRRPRAPVARITEALRRLALTDQVVIDAMNDFDPSDLNERTSSEVVAELVGPPAS